MKFPFRLRLRFDRVSREQTFRVTLFVHKNSEIKLYLRRRKLAAFKTSIREGHYTTGVKNPDYQDPLHRSANAVKPYGIRVVP